MLDQDIFDIKNFRLIQPKQIKTQGVSRHPLQQSLPSGLDLVQFEGERLQPTEDFGTVYVGEQMRAMAQIRYKQHINQVLEYVNIEIIVTQEEEKRPVKIAETRVTNIKGGDDINVPFSQKMSVEKTKPFINNPSSAPIIPENQKNKQYRISPKLPFLIDKTINIALYPKYYVEYSLQAKTQTDFVFKTVTFLPADQEIFDAQLIVDNESGGIKLKPEEKEKIIFKIEVKPSKMNQYQALLKKDQANISIGSIFLEWGICGTYMSKPEEVPLIRNDIELEFYEKPDLILRKVTRCKLLVSNPMRNCKKLKIYLRDLDMEGIKVVGLDNTIIDFTQNTSGKFELGIHVLPHQPGIQCVKGLTFYNEETKKYCNIRNSLSVLVRTTDEQLIFQTHQSKMVEEVIDFFSAADDSQQQTQVSQGTQQNYNKHEEDDIHDFFSNATQPTNNVYVSDTNQNFKNIPNNQPNNSGKQNVDSIFDEDLIDFDSTGGQQQQNMYNQLSNSNNEGQNNNYDLL